ncbi:MAG TPA: FHA domain-containing protein [Intrasporangium sp.]|uniref:FHA domain-containing protein n=1 Tax=Intrasporangium sp. TaxID=1925024 RepID=UPI002D791880|nr:FHA domain-containing protein [Intrasporangium sp.]HET7398719.1 FHA domain-containing protein [Intrasporangium sp.]
MSSVCPNGHPSAADDYCDVCGTPITAAASGAETGAGGEATPGRAAASGGTLSGETPSSLTIDPFPSAPAPAAPAGPPPESTALECPNCATGNPEGALFCEACGYDFTTGAMPRGLSASTGAADPGQPAAGAAQPGAAQPGAGAAPGTPTQSGSGSPGDVAWVAEVWVDPDWYQTQQAEDPCPSPGLPTIVPLRRRSVLLGRVSVSRNTHPEIDLSSDPGVSRRHAQLTTDGSRWFVEDLGSSNGTFVGPASGPLPEKPIAVGPRTELDDDDRLYVGAWTRVVVREATPDEVTAHE